MVGRIEVVQDDLTNMGTDAIVTPAAENLARSDDGIDRAVRRAAGPDLDRERRRLFGCSEGKAKISRGYKLPARHVIHTVGARWSGGESGEDAVLASCYRASLELAAKHELHSVAVPLLGADLSIPTEVDAAIAFAEIQRFLESHDAFERVVVCCDDVETYQTCVAMT